MGESLGAILTRKLREPTTWIGIGQAIVTGGLATTQTVDLIVTAGMALWSLANMMRREPMPAVLR